MTRIDLCAPGIRLRATAPGEGPRTVSSFGQLVGGIVAINGDWWSKDGANPSLPSTYPRGLAVGNGQHFAGTPRSCVTREVPPSGDGIIRQVESRAIMDAWGCDWHEVRLVSKENLSKYEEGASWPATPRAIQGDGPAIFAVESGVRRHITSPYSLKSWRFSLRPIETLTSAEVSALPEGAPMVPTPVLVMSSGLKVYAVDYPPAEQGSDVDGGSGSGSGSSSSGSSSGSGSGGSGGLGSDAGVGPPEMGGGCSVRNRAGEDFAALWSLLWLMAAALTYRRRGANAASLCAAVLATRSRSSFDKQRHGGIVGP